MATVWAGGCLPWCRSFGAPAAVERELTHAFGIALPSSASLSVV